MNSVNNLTNHFLLAMPQLGDSYFGQSVCYICDHNENGSMGLVINKPMGISLGDIFSELDITASKQSSRTIMQGGPVSPEQGFVLYEGHYNNVENTEISKNIRLSTSKEILAEIASGNGPEEVLVCLGYAGWEAGQLEEELAANTWLTVEADEELLFHTPAAENDTKAAKKIGVDINLLTTQSGHA
jgi:putative transcriptional regulator